MSLATKKRVLLAAPRGYCAGVDRAVITVEKASAAAIVLHSVGLSL